MNIQGIAGGQAGQARKQDGIEEMQNNLKCIIIKMNGTCACHKNLYKYRAVPLRCHHHNLK